MARAPDKGGRTRATRTGAGGLVYSTDGGRQCPGCRRPVDDCRCRDRSRPRDGGDGTVVLERQTKGRKGAGVTLVRGLALSDADVDKLARRLKARCSVGGTVRDGIIELQGDQRGRVQGLLEADGFKVKLSGG